MSSTELEELRAEFNLLQSNYDDLHARNDDLRISHDGLEAEMKRMKLENAQLWKRLKGTGGSPKVRAGSPNGTSPSKSNPRELMLISSSPTPHLLVPEMEEMRSVSPVSTAGSQFDDEELALPVSTFAPPSESIPFYSNAGPISFASDSAPASLHSTPSTPFSTRSTLLVDVLAPIARSPHHLEDLPPVSPFDFFSNMSRSSPRHPSIGEDVVETIFEPTVTDDSSELSYVNPPLHHLAASSNLASLLVNPSTPLTRSPSPTTTLPDAIPEIVIPTSIQPTSSLDSIPALSSEASRILVPALLPYAHVQVVGSSMKCSDKGKETPSIHLQLTLSFEEGAEPRTQSWMVSKCYRDLTGLDENIRFNRSKSGDKITALPEKGLLKDHAPPRVDSRIPLFEYYFKNLIQLRPPSEALCSFFNLDIVEPDTSSKFSGWLTKKGRSFGATWQTRYYRLSDDLTSLRYYESHTSKSPLGSLSLTNASIGRQSNKNLDSNEYRHAFLIRTEEVDHVFSADNDEDRDEWVQALMSVRIQDYQDEINIHEKEQSEVSRPTTPSLRTPPAEKPNGSHNPVVRSRSADPLPTPPTLPPRQVASPISIDVDGSQEPYAPPLPPRGSVDSSRHATKSIPLSTTHVSVPTNATPLPNGYDFKGQSSSSSSRDKDKRTKTKSFWGFSHKSSTLANSNGDSKAIAQSTFAPPSPLNPVFGVPLKEAVSISRVREGLELPAVVFRCIEFLDAHDAKYEEGIFRLSGSTMVIRNLKDRFNSERDVNLLAGDEDIHAIAGLLKAYLRELPNHILTKELRADFAAMVELEEEEDRIAVLRTLLDELPIENFTLIQFLFRFLSTITQNADRTQMGRRNLGIVFSPTLKLAAPLFTMLLDYWSESSDSTDVILSSIVSSEPTSSLSERRNSRPPARLTLEETTEPLIVEGGLPSAVPTISLPSTPRSANTMTLSTTTTNGLPPSPKLIPSKSSRIDTTVVG